MNCRVYNSPNLEIGENMNKFNLALLGLVLAFTGVSAHALDLSVPTVSGTVSADSRDEWRGQKYSDQPSIGLALKANDLGVKGLYVDGDFSKDGNDFPLNSFTVIRSDVGVGYAFKPVTDFTVDASLHHVYNAQEFLMVKHGQLTYGDYSEFRLKASYSVLFAEVTQGVGRVQDNYAKVGVDLPVTDKLHVGAAVSGYHYKTSTNNRYNNSEVFASYDVLKGLKVYGKYSFGGKTDSNLVLSNYGLVGVSYSF